MIESVDNLNFIGALTLHQNRRDVALGLTHITTKQRGLIWYYNIKQHELFSNVAKASFRLGVVKQAQRRMNKIILEVQNAKSHDESMVLLKEAKKLKKTIKRLNA